MKIKKPVTFCFFSLFLPDESSSGKRLCFFSSRERHGKRPASKKMIAKSKRSIQWIKRLKRNRSVEYIGTHFVADFWNARMIEDEKELQNLLVEAVKAAKGTPLKSAIHKFSPQGITGVIVLSESHLSIHTWPEKNYIAVDVFTCGNTADPEKAIEYLKEKLSPEKVKMRKIKRGKIS